MLGRFPLAVQKVWSSSARALMAAEVGIRRVMFWSDRDWDRPASWGSQGNFISLVQAPGSKDFSNPQPSAH